jgi:hypothetical protein
LLWIELNHQSIKFLQRISLCTFKRAHACCNFFAESSEQFLCRLAFTLQHLPRIPLANLKQYIRRNGDTFFGCQR